ncbi:MAG: HD domain-containing protein [Armatimonadota bacterium]
MPKNDIRGLIRDSNLKRRANEMVVHASEWLRVVPYPNGLDHSVRLAEYATELLKLAKASGSRIPTDSELFLLNAAILLHDIGKGIGTEPHGAASATIIRDKWQKFNLANDLEASLVAAISQAHTAPPPDPFGGLSDKARLSHLGRDPINLRLVAALLLLIDEADDVSWRVDEITGKAPNPAGQVRRTIAGIDFEPNEGRVVFRIGQRLPDDASVRAFIAYTEERMLLAAHELEPYGLAIRQVALKDNASGRTIDGPPGHHAGGLPYLYDLDLGAQDHYMEFLWHPDGLLFDCHYEDRWVPLPADLKEHDAALRGKLESHSMGRKYFNGPCYGLTGLDYRIDPQTEQYVVMPTFANSDYARFLATDGWHPGLAKLAGLSPERPPSLRSLTLAEAMPKGLVNSLGMNMVLVSTVPNDQVLLVQRSNDLAHWGGAWHISANEGLKRAFPIGDQQSAGDATPDMNRFALRTLSEECGLQDHIDEILLLSLGHHSASLQPALIGYAVTDRPADDVTNMVVGASTGKLEVERLKWIRFDADSVADFIAESRQPGANEIVPWAEIALFRAVLSYSHRRGAPMMEAFKIFTDRGLFKPKL